MSPENKHITPDTAPVTAPVIAIDGTAASGKGTLARRLAAALNLPHLDTGRLYRYVGWRVLQAGGNPEDPAAATAQALAASAAITPEALLNEELNEDPVSRAASQVAAIPAVREALLALQQNFAARPGGAILDGRDIGTVICPAAPLKIFVDADIGIRAQRRHKELQNRGLFDTYDAVLAMMRERDARDSGRADAPMKPADDAVIIDTTEMDAEQAFTTVLALARQRLGLS